MTISLRPQALGCSYLNACGRERLVCDGFTRATTTNRRFNEGNISVGRHHHLWEDEHPFQEMKGKHLAVRNLEMFPAKQTRIDGPGTRSDHRQGDTQCCQHDGNPATGARISSP